VTPSTYPVKPGDAFQVLGMKIVIVQVTSDGVTYVCRHGAYTGPTRRRSLEEFDRLLAQAILAPAEPP
jgi:hypothetical protein